MIKKVITAASVVALLLTACRTEPEETTVTEDSEMILAIDGTEVPVIWEDNTSVGELEELAASGLTIEMSMYGGFEQVGPVGSTITSSDVQITTSPGDIVLYSGDQMVIFYGSNSWSYTRLGRIDLPSEEITELLSGSDVTITITGG
ncbi:MAG: hypothetical protein IJ869_08030 [Clostridiales bacterium]|nr:hypothetical protein [Clostridiales bacterium]